MRINLILAIVCAVVAALIIIPDIKIFSGMSGLLTQLILVGCGFGIGFFLFKK